MFDTAQQAAIDSETRRLLVLAGAGTGKTTMMLGRIHKLVESGANPGSILALTFTNAAASEMRERYKASATGDVIPTFSTFHAFCYRLIIADKAVANALGYTSVPSVADDNQVKRIWESCRAQCGTKLSDKKLRDPSLLNPRDRFAYDVFHTAYRKMLCKENLITFDLMCGAICQLFYANKPIIQQYKDRFKYIFVDEFQDTDETQWRFVQAFKNSRVTVVGDAKQNLYAFRGCTNEIIKRLTKDPEWVTIKLHNNYRCTKQICNFANRIHRSWGDSPYNLMLEGQRDGAEVNWKPSFHSMGSQTEHDVLALTSGLYDGKSIAILCRTNAEVSLIGSILSSYGVKCDTSIAETDLIDCIEAAFDDTKFMNWVPAQLNSHDYAEYIRSVYVNPAYAEIDTFMKQYKTKLPKSVNSAILARTVVKSSKYDLNEKAARIADIFHINTGYKTQEFADLGAVCRYIKSCYQSRKSSGSIYVGTIHSVKGLEYDNVHVLGVDGKYFRLSNEDNLNCFYVACTRAKENLTVWMEDNSYEDHEGYN